MDPTASKEAPKLELAEELVAAGLNVLVSISVEVCTAVPPGGLPVHKNHDHTESKSVSLSQREPVGLKGNSVLITDV
jgi:hypothetical protein